MAKRILVTIYILCIIQAIKDVLILVGAKYD